MFLNISPDLNKPFSDEELANLGIEEVAGVLLAIDLRDVTTGEPLHGLALCPTVPPKLLNLLMAGPHMYQQLGREYAMLQSVIEYLETVNATVKKQSGQPWVFAEQLVNTFTEMQNHILNARRIACEGPVKVAEEMRRGS